MAVEAALAIFAQALQRPAELQTVGLQDIASHLHACKALVQ